MYSKAATALKHNLPVFLLYAVLLAVITENSKLASRVFLTFGVNSIFIFSCHRMILKGETFLSPDGFARSSTIMLKFVPYFYRLCAFTLIFAVIGVAFIRLSQLPKPEAIWFSIFASTVTFGFVLAVFGTVFAASSIGEDASISRAFRRGLHTATRTLWRFLVGSVLFFIVFALFGFGLVSVLLFASLPYQLTHYFINFVSAFGLSIAILLGSTALCLAYEEGEAVLK